MIGDLGTVAAVDLAPGDTLLALRGEYIVRDNVPADAAGGYVYVRTDSCSDGDRHTFVFRANEMVVRRAAAPAVNGSSRG